MYKISPEARTLKVYIAICEYVLRNLWFCFVLFFDQGFGREKDGNRGEFISSNLVIFCYKEFEKYALCKSVSQSEATFIVYSEPIESGHDFSKWQHIQNVNRDNKVENL